MVLRDHFATVYVRERVRICVCICVRVCACVYCEKEGGAAVGGGAEVTGEWMDGILIG